MSAFVLSPGITPELADAFVIELPIAVGIGYLLARRTGFAFAFALNALVLGTLKVVTDYGDLPDVLIALGALASGATWAILSIRGRSSARAARAWCAVLGVGTLVAGLVKLRDFYDPFDLLLADCAVVSGLAVALYAQRPSLNGEHDPPPASAVE